MAGFLRIFLPEEEGSSECFLKILLKSIEVILRRSVVSFLLFLLIRSEITNQLELALRDCDDFKCIYDWIGVGRDASLLIDQTFVWATLFCY